MNEKLRAFAFSVIAVLGPNACGGDFELPSPDASPSLEPSPSVPPTPTVEAMTPNILLVIADDLGLDASAQYEVSQDLPHTPTLDALAAQGLVFDNAWATPQCTTTRGTLISGLHGVNSGVDTVPDILDPSVMTLQRYLTEQSDYQSAVFGKWHIAGGNPDANHPASVGVPYYAGNIAGVLDDYFAWPLITNGVVGESDVYHTTAVTDLALDWIAEQTQPWFVWLAYVAPHSPFHLPPENLHNRSLPGTPAHIRNNTRDYFLAAIEAMDTELGRLLDSLPPGVREDTLVVFVGDNGSPGRAVDTAVFARARAKGTLYEGGIRVPLIASGAGVERRGEREAALINTVDFFPTVTELLGINPPPNVDGQSFYSLLNGVDNSGASDEERDFNYAEFVSSDVSGWAVRDASHKLIEFADGSRELYAVDEDLSETNNLIAGGAGNYQEIIDTLAQYAATVRRDVEPSPAPGAVDITNALLTERSANCADYVNSYSSTVTDVNTNTVYQGSLAISVDGAYCSLATNAIPNHDFNDGVQAFPNPVSVQDDLYRIPAVPVAAAAPSRLLLTQDNALLLNGVKVDLLAAACFGVGNGRVGCNNINQPWRYDPMFAANGFRVDSHNAHTQPNGTYHYHGNPNALFDSTGVSPLVGFAADGFPIFGSYIEDDGTVRRVQSSYRLKAGNRPSGEGDPGGAYDGTFRDDYEYVAGLGDLDECNGMTVDGVYGYYVIDEFPYVMACFKGTPDDSFFKGN